MREKAFVTPELLKWARVTAKMSLQYAAEKLKVPENRLRAWEAGEASPTLAQAEKLSKLYRRPLAVFYLPVPPKDFETLRDFRGRKSIQDYSPALNFMIRDILARQAWISEIRKEEGEEPLYFIGKFSISNTVTEIAADILNVFSPSEDTIHRNDLREWIKRVEKKGIFVSVSGSYTSKLPIDIEDARGFAAFDRYAPFIFINGKDYPNSQLFTLIHELAHLWIGESGVSDINLYEQSGISQDSYVNTETFCNRVAANVLMPEDKLLAKLSDFEVFKLDGVEKLAKQFGVSSYALLIRLFELNALPRGIFFRLKEEITEKFKQISSKDVKEATGGPDYYRVMIRKNSRLFTQTVYSLYKGGRILGSEASDLLSIKVERFAKLHSYLGER